MKPKDFRRIRMMPTAEGFALLVLLAFIFVCSILRNVNLLVVISGMLIVPLVLCWRLSRSTVRNVVVERLPTKKLHARQPCHLQWSATNLGTTNIYDLEIIDTVFPSASPTEKRAIAHSSGSSISEGRLRFGCICPGETSVSSFQVFFGSRGRFQLGDSVVASRFPLGLVKSWFRTHQRQQILVAPPLGELKTNWHHYVSEIRSDHASRTTSTRSDRSDSFYGIRQWRSGDQRKHLHWRSTAKYRQPMMKQFERINDQSMNLVVDLTTMPTDFHSHEEHYLLRNHCELMLSFVATLVVDWSSRVTSQLSILFADHNPRAFHSKSDPDFLNSVMRELATTEFVDVGCLEKCLTHSQNEYDRTPPIVISTRSMDITDLNSLSEHPVPFHWIEVGSPEFEKLFALRKDGDPGTIEKTKLAARS